jgi:very-short-patch-repair endonuclease/predicted transcriptional regulator of viral defense system
MGAIDRAIAAVAAGQLGLVTRADVVAAGGTDDIAKERVRAMQWQRLQRGVYLVAAARPTWEQRMLAACMAAGPGAVASHRAAAALWRLDGIRLGPLEITVPHQSEPIPSGVIVHRSTWLYEEERAQRAGVPVTSVARTLLDVGAVAPEVVVERALEDAVRRNLTTGAAVEQWLGSRSRRGCRGAATLRRVLELRGGARPAGSAAEVRLIRLLRDAGIAPPVRQHPIPLLHGEVAVVDLAWPRARVALEFDGYATHGGRRAWAHDLARDNAIRDAGWALRRVTWADLRDRPERLVTSISSLLCGVVGA